MAIAVLDDVMLREPRLLVPGAQPIGRVKVDWTHPMTTRLVCFPIGSNTFSGSQSVSYFHPEGTRREGFLEEVKRCLQTERPYDIIAISAGFDRHEEDWGGLLKTEDYLTIGKWAKEASLERCQGRRFGVAGRGL